MSRRAEQDKASPGSGTAQQFAEEIEAQLRAAANPERAAQEKRYLKSELAFLGVGVPAMRTIAKDFARSHQDLDRLTLVALVNVLWSTAIHELRTVAVELLDCCLNLLDPADVLLVERLLRESRTWALVDDLAGNIAGRLVERYPELNEILDRWSVDADFWLRRASVLALLGPLRRGDGDFDRFGRFADAMLDEKEFFIRKAIGWVLRETGKKRPELVYAWLAPRTARASGVTLREAVKYLPDDDRRELLTAYRERRSTNLY